MSSLLNICNTIKTMMWSFNNNSIIKWRIQRSLWILFPSPRLYRRCHLTRITCLSAGFPKITSTMAKFIGVVLLASIVGFCNGLPRIINGRRRGGSLGKLPVPPDTELPKGQFFTQYLDHFNNADIRTWQQVGEVLVYYNIHKHVTAGVKWLCCRRNAQHIKGAM